MNAMALPLLGMVGLVLAELFYQRMRKGQAIPWRDMVLNLNSGHILMWFFRGLEVAVYAWVLKSFSLGWAAAWHPWAVWILALLVWDLGFYWMHRLHHKFALLWSVHAVHHEGEHFNLSLGIRNAWASSLTTLPFTTLPLAFFGVPLEVFLSVSILHYTVQFYNHNSIVERSGWLEKVLITPAHHRVHHGCNPEYLDRNFGGTFLMWDQLFGTFQPRIADVPVQYGVHQPTLSCNPLWANLVPLLRYARLPVPHLTRGKPLFPGALIGAGGLLLFAVVAYYIYREGQWPQYAQPFFFAIIFIATIALGAMSDGRGWGLPVWLALAAAALGVLPLCFGLRDGWGLGLLALWLIHGLAALLLVLCRTHHKES
ncbi:sterol desaturase family protein [Comamonas composti]|uniref:sterol desaturase family protein n=1 Tax=Comamonas composti TaxID=408558 RepID=UPI00041F5089|nr:sterol desaturase family protein [Comamonas composti]